MSDSPPPLSRFRAAHFLIGFLVIPIPIALLAVTGEPPTLILRAFEDLGFVPFALPGELKPLYHAAAVLASGHAATLWLGAGHLLEEAGIRLPGRGLLALAEAMARNVERHGAAGRTGPFVRGDAETIARDAAALPEDWRALFLALGRMG